MNDFTHDCPVCGKLYFPGSEVRKLELCISLGHYSRTMPYKEPHRGREIMFQKGDNAYAYIDGNTYGDKVVVIPTR